MNQETIKPTFFNALTTKTKKAGTRPALKNTVFYKRI